MKYNLKLEELGMFLLSIILFTQTEFSWWWFPALILLPDIGMVGYAINNRYGAYCYNLFHHKGIAVLFFGSGFFLKMPYLELTGIILFGHASMDRIFGYGLKFTNSFQNTHLGTIGKN
ncbi:DUF4260 domain-containing protein [Fodinibius halophilus]|uniref:DUF4260 domain-containing protein n=1 Tax=Fodinibius halophilus TaxID=1736908 RepID=A0A6M1T480_9BACT|nr:DUF4260 domain-containing protein [Fodinibius halophilus]NGP88899.1 DUF4260 domain-containing protein [Fodinibius halophilus]